MNRLYGLALLLLLNACATSRKTDRHGSEKSLSISSLKFLDEYVIPHNLQYQNSIVGGLSGIDYDMAGNRYFIISDDRSHSSAARFYTANIVINADKIDTVVFTSVLTLKQADGSVFPSFAQNAQRAPDPESIRFNPKNNTLTWTSEGDRAVRNGKMIYQNPYIYQMDVQGNFLDSFFIPDNLKMYAHEKGARENGVFEGSSFDKNFRWLYVSMETPIYEDGPVAKSDYAGAPIRITQYDVKTKQAVMQYAYPLDAVANKPRKADDFYVNGVDEILCIGPEKFIVMERSFTNAIMQSTIKLFLADFSGADNVLNVASLYPHNGYKAVTKKLLFNLDDLGRYVDNVEGITLGPVLANGHQSLLLIADNNFNVLEKAQVFLFEIIP